MTNTPNINNVFDYLSSFNYADRVNLPAGHSTQTPADTEQILTDAAEGATNSILTLADGISAMGALLGQAASDADRIGLDPRQVAKVGYLIELSADLICTLDRHRDDAYLTLRALQSK